MFDLSAAIRSLQDRGWSQSEIADHVGMHQSFVNRLANEKSMYVDWRVGICLMGLAFSHALPPREIRRDITKVVLEAQAARNYRVPKTRKLRAPQRGSIRNLGNG